MSKEALEYLNCSAGGRYVDATLGGGGHTQRILEATKPDGQVIAIDADDAAIDRVKKKLSSYEDRITLVRDNFRNIKEVLAELNIDKVDGILFDVGLSSDQLDSTERGFSFSRSARLDMRMDRRLEVSAFEIVNQYGEEELASIFYRYGEERRARAVARAIVAAREISPIETTEALAGIVEGVLPKRRHGEKKSHPATKVFQALRIAVNDELNSLEEAIRDGIELIASGGRMVVISFHSLEDKLVKGVFREFATGCICPRDVALCACGRLPRVKLLFKRALSAGAEEVLANPRARSAKLRAIEVI
ncbi:MAG: 16S rRNA (cytosine(1402)-N(4))-methyltransferase RsmH [Deltaproteobacteria bacterium]|nr:16S rRNA (cytosine(1402)-N(4))-methyltransferase RsmH [Deltaproteobacteria bacterium]